MATRSSIRFATREEGVSFNELPETINAKFYAHWDGYPSNRGVEIAESLLGKGKIENDILKKNLALIKDGTSKIIIGTHALISKNIEFKNLKLAVIDEQHRFGVNQRIALVEKGQNVNLLVMSATPIPRSLALTSYGDMSITNLKNKPAGRQKIKTSTISSKKINKLYEGLKRQLLKDSLIYWVCPTIDESKENNLISIEQRYKKLKM